MLDGYTDADMAGDLDGRKSTSGYLMTYGGEQFHGRVGYRNVLFCLLQKQSLSQLLNLVRKHFSCRSFYKSLA